MERVFALFPRLEERRQQIAGTMSGGEQSMLSIGRGLMSSPDLMIFDEPSLGLAPVLVEHNVAVAQRREGDGREIESFFEIPDRAGGLVEPSPKPDLDDRRDKQPEH